MSFVFGPTHPPVVHVSRGETIIIETQDCFGGQLTEDPATHNCLDKENQTPVTGPIYVEGAAVGDVLCIYIQKINIASEGLVVLKPKRGTLGKDVRQTLVRQVSIQDNLAKISDTVSVPVEPVIGCIGVAPRHGEITTMYPGRHGGNMDTKDITVGTRVFLPVQVKGGMFSLGDVKACMGDGASIGGGVEITSEITVRMDIVPGGRFSWPRLETTDSYVTVTSASSVGQASRLAVMEMVRWLEQEKGLDFDTAYLTVGLSGNLMISQWFNPLVTARVVFPKNVMRKIQNRDPIGARSVFPPSPILPEEDELSLTAEDTAQNEGAPVVEAPEETVSEVQTSNDGIPIVTEDAEVSVAPPSSEADGDKEPKAPPRRRRRRYRRRPAQGKKEGTDSKSPEKDPKQDEPRSEGEGDNEPKTADKKTVASNKDSVAASTDAQKDDEGAKGTTSDASESKPPSRRRRTWRRRSSRSSTRRKPASSSNSGSDAPKAAGDEQKENKAPDKPATSET